MQQPECSQRNYGTLKPLHEHLLTGTEIDIDEAIPVPEARASQRQRLLSSNTVLTADRNRIFEVAPWLDKVGFELVQK